ncbi:hypothetical protein T484DRAFT_2016386 [Baffinella frigidus]|nr:hypothetical protein T484DRAFT_2016386 [Cryptophyta sp. CCMP2293]
MVRLTVPPINVSRLSDGDANPGPQSPLAIRFRSVIKQFSPRVFARKIMSGSTDEEDDDRCVKHRAFACPHCEEVTRSLVTPREAALVLRKRFINSRRYSSDSQTPDHRPVHHEFVPRLRQFVPSAPISFPPPSSASPSFPPPSSSAPSSSFAWISTSTSPPSRALMRLTSSNLQAATWGARPARTPRFRGEAHW